MTARQIFMAAALVLVALPSPRAAADGRLASLLGQIRPGRGDPRFQPDQRQVREAACTIDRQHRILTNVRWGYRQIGQPESWRPIYESTAVPAGGVKEVYLVLEPFAPKWAAAHTMLAFTFSDGRRVSSRRGCSKGLCVALEAHLKRGQAYGLLDGMKGKFGVVHTATTWEDMVQKVVGKDRLELVTYRLRLSQRQRDALLRRSLDAATTPLPGLRYNTLSRSCYTSLVSLVNSVVPRKQRVRQYWIPRVLRNPFATVPGLAARAFARKGLIDRASRRVYRPRKP
jgi:hypothetical protein